MDTSRFTGYQGRENVPVTDELTQAAIYGDLIRRSACDPDVARGELLRLPRRRPAHRLPGGAPAGRRHPATGRGCRARGDRRDGVGLLRVLRASGARPRRSSARDAELRVSSGGAVEAVLAAGEEARAKACVSAVAVRDLGGAVSRDHSRLRAARGLRWGRARSPSRSPSRPVGTCARGRGRSSPLCRTRRRTTTVEHELPAAALTLLTSNTCSPSVRTHVRSGDHRRLRRRRSCGRSSPATPGPGRPSASTPCARETRSGRSPTRATQATRGRASGSSSAGTARRRDDRARPAARAPVTRS